MSQSLWRITIVIVDRSNRQQSPQNECLDSCFRRSKRCRCARSSARVRTRRCNVRYCEQRCDARRNRLRRRHPRTRRLRITRAHANTPRRTQRLACVADATNSFVAARANTVTNSAGHALACANVLDNVNTTRSACATSSPADAACVSVITRTHHVASCTVAELRTASFAPAAAAALPSTTSTISASSNILNAICRG
jgi:hypothetical protein